MVNVNMLTVVYRCQNVELQVWLVSFEVVDSTPVATRLSPGVLCSGGGYNGYTAGVVTMDVHILIILYNEASFLLEIYYKMR